MKKFSAGFIPAIPAHLERTANRNYRDSVIRDRHAVGAERQQVVSDLASSTSWHQSPGDSNAAGSAFASDSARASTPSVTRCQPASGSPSNGSKDEPRRIDIATWRAGSPGGSCPGEMYLSTGSVPPITRRDVSRAQLSNMPNREQRPFIVQPQDTVHRHTLLGCLV